MVYFKVDKIPADASLVWFSVSIVICECFQFSSILTQIFVLNCIVLYRGYT